MTSSSDVSEVLCTLCDVSEDCCSCFTCENCSEKVGEDDAFSDENGDVYCEQCFERLFTHCSDCGCVIPNTDTYCDSCEEDYFYCEGCDERTHLDRGYYNERSGHYYCESCYPGDTDCKLIEHYHYEPHCGTVFHGDGPLFFGLEVEVEFDDYETRNDYVETLVNWAYKKFGNHFRFVIPQRDGSLDDDTGVEFVFQPQSIEKLKENFFSMPYPETYDLNIRSGVGIHVNISRDALSNDAWARFVRFIYEEKEFWISESGRNSVQWADFSDSMLVKLDNPIFPRDKYTAVRVGYDRVEVRTFKSRLTPERLIDVSKLCYDLVKFSESISNEEFMDLSNSAALLESFKHFRTHRSPLKLFFDNPYSNRVLLLDSIAKVFKKVAAA